MFRIFSPIILLILLSTFACEINTRTHTPISGETVIDIQEKKIIFDKPFKPQRIVVRLCFISSDELNIYSYGDMPKFPDGTSLDLTVSVFDQNEKKYELNYIATSFGNTVCFEPKELKDGWLNISKTNVTFTKLIVRSNREIKISRIEWDSFNPWAWEF